MSTTYKEITEQIIAAIEDGASGKDWRMPWHVAGGGMPVNVASKKPYRGINTLSLWCAAKDRGYASSEWGTLRQWNAEGGRVRKGERSSLVVFWKPIEGGSDAGEDGDETSTKRFALRVFYAFNRDQIDGLDVPAPVVAPRDPMAADRLVNAAGVNVRFGGGRAFYDMRADRVTMPIAAAFESVEAFQSTLLHEAAHWTGHESRLNREFGKRFGDKAYAFEELVAELSAAFLCADLGIASKPRLDHAQYVESWLSVLKGDNRAIFTASAAASRAAEYLTSASKSVEKVA